MPSFGLPSSMPPVSSSLAPGMSTFASANVISSCQETSCAPPLPDGCMSHLFGPPHLPPPPPLSLSDAAPYSPPPSYPTVFPFGPPLLPSARFPPPPNPSFARPMSNMTVFEGPQSRYPPEPHTPYDRWSDRNVNSTAYGGGGDHMSKSFGHWPLPTFNSSSININNSNNNPNLGFLKPDPIFPPLTPYPPVDSVTNFGPKFSPLPGFPNAAGMPAAPSASVASPLPSGHFGVFPPPNLPLDFPHSSSRYPFNAHAPIFLPGMDSPPTFGPSNADFLPDPIPSYLSRAGGFQPSSSFQDPDHFLDSSSRPVPSSENAPRPITSDSPSGFYGPPPHTVHGSSPWISHTFSSRSDNAPGLLCASEGAPVLEFLSDFPAPFTLPYPPPPPGSLFPPYSADLPPPPLYQDSSRNGGSSSAPPTKDEDRRDQIVGETGKLMHQIMSPEEWRWNHYEPSFADALDPSGIFARVRPSGYNHFHGFDSTVSNSSGCFVIKEEGSTSGEPRSQKEQLEILESCQAQNQSGPSLKLAASALVEMLASGSSSAASSTSRSMVSQVEGTSGTAFTSEGGFDFGNASSGGQARSERMLEDCCSSSGSAFGHKEGGDGPSSLSHEFGGLKVEDYVSGLNSYSPARGKREISGLQEDAFCDFGGVPAAWARPKAPGRFEDSTNLRPMSPWVDAVPQSAKGGAMHTSGQRKVFSKGSAGIMKQPSVANGPAKVHPVVAESSTSENFNNLFTQSSNFSLRPQSGRLRKVSSSQPIGARSSDDPTSIIGPFASKGTVASGLSLFGPQQEVSSSGVGTPLPFDASHNDIWHVKSTSCGSSPPLSQAYLDLHVAESTQRTMGTPSRALANLKWSGPESSSQTEVTYLGTGFHSLTASISNLSKVLFSLDSSARGPPDSAILEENLQSSILRLSECLLLEQTRINRNRATRFVGSDDSSASRQARADGSFTDTDLGCHAETGLSTNLGHFKASEVRHSGSLSDLSNVNDIVATGTIAELETVDPGSSVINSHNLQKPFPLNNVTYSVSKHSMDDVGIRAGKDPCHGYDDNSKHSSSSQQKGAVADDEMLQLLRENDIFERSSLERLIDAAKREAKLKVLVEELREELELERVENRGTALLCEKIMQETRVSKGKAVIQGAQNVDFESRRGNSSTCDNSTLDRTWNGEASGVKDQSVFTRYETVIQSEFGEEMDSASPVKSSVNAIDQVESRLALLRGRGAGLTAQLKTSNDDGTGSELRAGMHAVARGNSYEDAVLNNGDRGDSQRTCLLAQPAAIAPKNISHDTSGSVESRLALLQARPTAMPEHSPHDTNRDADVVVPYPGAIRSTSQDSTTEEVEARLALLRERSGWDNELGVFTETEPCTPANPVAIDLDSGTGSFSGPSLPGLNEERVAFAAKALKAMSHITSQLLIQSETISNMHTAWSQLSEQVNNSKSLEKESNTDLQQKEADGEIKIGASKQPFYGIQAVEARALLIRSRPDWTEGDVSDSETEDFLGGQVCKVSSTNSGCLLYESDQFEEMNEISLVRLLDSDVVSQSIQVKGTTDGRSLRAAMGESSKFENGNPAITQDVEEDSGWEHVRFPQKDSK